MKLTSNTIKIYFYSTIALTLFTSTLYTLSFFVSFDTPIGYFSSNSILPYIATAILIFTIIFILSIYFFIPPKAIATPSADHSALSRAAAAFASLGLFLCGVARIIFLPRSPLSTICTVLSLLSITFFALTALYRQPNKNALTISGVIVILWAALSMTEAYINQFITMNNPIKTFLMLSMISIMLFMLYELRHFISNAFTRTYVIFNLIGILLSCTFSISFIIIYIFKIYQINEFMPTAIASFLILFYEVCRSVDFLKIHKITKS